MSDGATTKRQRHSNSTVTEKVWRKKIRVRALRFNGKQMKWCYRKKPRGSRESSLRCKSAMPNRMRNANLKKEDVMIIK